ncbi:germin 2-1 [Olea europaea subsp. europaea]|uniref:Germin-like protein n=1 Tax=Olea europaea subsp. europaea TaxID=158383 RepID=A0A8S0UP69_OLEEU|nr:germin 2-1 [Olea europaea subsp. europaea]
MADLVLTLISILAIGWTLVHAGEPSPLQDFCVADFDSPVRVNGHACLDPKKVTADRFYFEGLHKPGNTSNTLGSYVNRPTVDETPGLNTLGISTVRVNYAPRGVVPPHRHPRASEILIVLEGEKGDVFAFPFGLIHFQQNVGHGNAVTIAFLSSPNPGVIPIANTVFGSNPSINDDLLAKAFRVDKSIIRNLKSPY